jgi:hypothetical protein
MEMASLLTPEAVTRRKKQSKVSRDLLRLRFAILLICSFLAIGQLRFHEKSTGKWAACAFFIV